MSYVFYIPHKSGQHQSNKQDGFLLIELMFALLLGSLLCIGIFALLNSMEKLHRRQMIITHEQDNSRFIILFLREKIQTAGDWSCLKTSVKPRSAVIRRYTAKQADHALNITIKPNTDLLQLRECVRFHNKKQYLPVEYFIADTTRITKYNKKITALFYKIDDHPREELITGMTDFHIRLYHVPHSKKNIRAVRIDYLLSSINPVLKNKQPIWFNDKWITPHDFALYQSGILFIACRVNV